MTEARTELPADGAVRLGGRLVHVVNQPGPSVPVLLLGGCGVPATTWDPVVELLPDYAVVRLDRPGLGGTPWPGTMPQLAEEVATLVDAIKAVGGVAVVVGHSMAGPHAEALVREHPELVSGLVLVDGSVEWDPKPPAREAAWRATAEALRRSMRVLPVRVATALAGRAMMSAQTHFALPGAMVGLAKETYSDPEAIASVIAEQAAYKRQLWDLAELRTRTQWSGVPTVVITANADGGARWVADQARLASLLDGRQDVVEDSRHLVMIDRPERVADAIRSVQQPGVADG